MIRQTSRPALLRSVLASTLVLGTALAFSVTSPAPAAESANEQDAPEPGLPCSKQTAECTVTWEADSDVCKDRKESGKCTTLHQCQAETLTAAKEDCERIHGVGGGKSGVESCGPCHWATKSADEKCKQICDKVYNKCMDRCKDDDCRNECFKDYVECLRECDK